MYKAVSTDETYENKTLHLFRVLSLLSFLISSFTTNVYCDWSSTFLIMTSGYFAKLMGVCDFISVTSYVAKRVTRLMPTVWITICIVSSIGLSVKSVHESCTDTIRASLLLYDHKPGHHTSFANMTFVSLLMQCSMSCLIISYACRFITLDKKYIFAAIGVMCFFLDINGIDFDMASYGWKYILGMLLWTAEFNRPTWASNWMCAMLLILASIQPRHQFDIDVVCVPVTALLLTQSNDLSSTPVSIDVSVRWLSKMSFPVFVVFHPTLHVMLQLSEGRRVPYMAVSSASILLTFMIAFLLHVLIERPVSSRRKSRESITMTVGLLVLCSSSIAAMLAFSDCTDMERTIEFVAKSAFDERPNLEVSTKSLCTCSATSNDYDLLAPPPGIRSEGGTKCIEDSISFNPRASAYDDETQNDAALFYFTWFNYHYNFPRICSHCFDTITTQRDSSVHCLRTGDVCSLERYQGRKAMFLIGDETALPYVPVLYTLAKAAHWGFAWFAGPRCGFLDSSAEKDVWWKDSCDPHLQTTRLLQSLSDNLGVGDLVFISEDPRRSLSESATRFYSSKLLNLTSNFMAYLLIIGPPPEVHVSLKGRVGLCADSHCKYEPRHLDRSESFIKAWTKENRGSFFISIADIFCNGSACVRSVPVVGKSVLLEKNVLSPAAARFAMSYICSFLEENVAFLHA